MDLKEMQAFVDSVSDYSVNVVKVHQNDLKPYAGHTYVDSEGTPTIEVSDYIYSNLNSEKSSEYFIKGFLLHELGHINTNQLQSPHENEYNAHMWAIEKSIELKLKRVTMSLREEILSWSSLSDTSCYSKYRKASSMYRSSNGFVV